MPQIEVETHKVAVPEVVVPTLETVRHEASLLTWLAEHKPMVLCEPPGNHDSTMARHDYISEVEITNVPCD